MIIILYFQNFIQNVLIANFVSMLSSHNIFHANFWRDLKKDPKLSASRARFSQLLQHCIVLYITYICIQCIIYQNVINHRYTVVLKKKRDGRRIFYHR